MSVGEWLNSVIQRDQGEDFTDDERLAQRVRNVSRHHRDRSDSRPLRYEGGPYRNDNGGDHERNRHLDDDRRERGHRSRRDSESDDVRAAAREQAQREAYRTREELGEVRARLDKLSQQLERLAEEPNRRLTGAPPPRRAANNSSLSIEDAVAEIAERQRALDNDAGPTPAPASVLGSAPTPAYAPAVDLGGLEEQLRQITARIEALQPARDIEKAITAVRTDLGDISRQLTEALPRRAVESLEIEVKALAERIDHSRQSGVDVNVLAGLEHGLAEVREALRRLTPAENLVGFEEAVHALAQKVDLIIAREDPTALQQLETAIGGLRGIVSHVASNDTLTRVAEEVRALAAQVDGIANNAATGHAVSALEKRIDTLAAALNASSEAGRAVPHDLEKMLAGLIEKLEWVQLTHTDHAALAHLEDRIATLVKRFDASDARLGHLEAIERGLADLLVHIEQMRGLNGNAAAGAGGARLAPAATRGSERDVTTNKQSERQSRDSLEDSLEAVQGTVEHVVDRLATIEGDLRRDVAPRVGPATDAETAPEPASPPREMAPAAAVVMPSPPVPAAATSPPPARTAAVRPPIDPSLPPDHPLEPGSAGRRSRAMPSAAERVAASEAAIGSAKPPVIPDPGRPNFIAAARRAAQAAAWEPSEQQDNKGEAAAEASAAKPNKLSQRLRKLIVASGAVLILVGCLRIAVRLFDDGGQAALPQSQSQSQSEQSSPPGNVATKQVAPEASPVPLSNPTGAAPPRPAPPTTKAAKPAHQSMAHQGGEGTELGAAAPPPDNRIVSTPTPSWAPPEITGAVPQPAAMPRVASANERASAVIEDKLPAAIGDPALRAAAMAGDPAAAYEVATRFAEGRGVTQSSEEAVHWFERAAKQGLAPAQFRLGGLYEKGTGVKKDLAMARDLYLAAAQKGNGKAMHNLAVLYAEGVNGPPDYGGAATWFRKAAEHGIKDSQYNLGILYARGIGVTQNFAESYKWFALAANQGDNDAVKKRDEVASHLDPQSLAAVRAALEQWSPEPQPDDAITVKTGAAWDSPAKGPHLARPKTRPAGDVPTSDR